jgi:hypothetical protein
LDPPLGTDDVGLGFKLKLTYVEQMCRAFGKGKEAIHISMGDSENVFIVITRIVLRSALRVKSGREANVNPHNEYR